MFYFFFFFKKIIIFLGRSIGSGPATYLASKYKIRSLVLVSPFTSIRAVVGSLLGNITSYIVK
jgi:abhydrolase domain-containing protein 17